METKDKKMTLEDYQKKYNKPYNEKVVKSFLVILAASLGIIIFFALFIINSKLYEINQYVFYAGLFVSALIYIFAYIIPLIKITTKKSFITYVSSQVNARKAKKYNKELRNELSDKIIDMYNSADVTYYKEENVKKLMDARINKNDKLLKENLLNVYKTDIKDACNNLIKDHAIKVGLSTAISQSMAIDTLFVATYDLNLIKDIIFLYGFRPNDRELAIIYKNVIASAIVAYGLSTLTSNLASGVASKLGKAAGGLPILGGVIGTVIDSVTQGVINASLTIMIGIETKKYLMKDYKLADILDDVVLSDEEALEEEALMIEEVKSSIKDKSKKNELKVA